MKVGDRRGEGVRKRASYHGMKGTRAYHAWKNMRYRCYDVKNNDYHSYGARGITVCDEWKDSFKTFFADMGPCPQGLTLERKDNSQGYGPNNCKWATTKEQSRNTRRNRYLEGWGYWRLLCDWAVTLKVKPSSIHRAMGTGRTLEQFAAYSRVKGGLGLVVKISDIK